MMLLRGAFTLLALCAPAAAQTSGMVIELNKLESSGSACQPHLVIENHTGDAFESMKLDLVLFDPDGIITRRIAVEAAPIGAGRTMVKAFNLKDLGCDAIGRILLNDLTACVDGKGARERCIDLIETRSRAKAPFIK